MKSQNTKLNNRITFLLISLTILAYLAKSYVEPNSPYTSMVNSLLTTLNMSILLSTNGFEKFFNNKFFQVLFAFACAFLILFMACKIISPKQADILLNSISAFSIAGTFIQNNK